MTRLAVLLGALCLCACEVGEGEGSVSSEHLYVEGCWEGPFDLRPTFFAANPFQETMTIRVQHGQQFEEEADGVLILINDVPAVREQLIGEPIQLGLPPSVRAPGFPIIPGPTPLVAMSMYLHSTCHEQNAALYAVGGWIRFDSLFNGNLNEGNAERRLTEAQFEAIMADPRDGILGRDEMGADTITYPVGMTSLVTGTFRFFFNRGTPAQPFP